MELEQLKSEWKATNNVEKGLADLQGMLLENKHPVLKQIRKQLTIEVVGWTAFVSCYYTMFDGEQKPIGVNITLIIAVLASLMHNIVGYDLSKNLMKGTTISESLQNYLRKLQRYAINSVVLRVIFTSGLLLFFSYNIEFDTTKYYLLGILILLIAVQLLFHIRTWSKQISSVKKSIGDLS
ncbi:hypothetical protein [Pedobacter deserti]|uniref:hypothetical protein n=1 Tax=Pedobacter deserti TaxID=2817382 RepID=UPI00210C2FB3|nr:hypothetical protein [Pedobacter sp. SYSU D00382]